MAHLAIAPARPPNSPRMTLEEWAAMDEDEPGELVDGCLVEEEVPSFQHEAAVSWLMRTLGSWVAPHGGWVFGSEFKYGVAPRRGRKPDVSLYLPGVRPPARDKGIALKPPSAVIEVISPQLRDVHRDRIEKMRDYAEFGVRFYWLLDPQMRLLEILELSEGKRYGIALAAAEGQQPVPGCDGLTLDLDALWAELEALPAEDEEPASDEP